MQPRLASFLLLTAGATADSHAVAPRGVIEEAKKGSRELRGIQNSQEPGPYPDVGTKNEEPSPGHDGKTSIDVSGNYNVAVIQVLSDSARIYENNAVIGSDSDLCALPKEVGPCKAKIPRYYFDPSEETCEFFYYGGCKGNANNFETKNECLETCKHLPTDLCALPKEVGPCEAAMPRYYFDPSKETCEFFYYGGCDGNANNFETKKECLETCKHFPTDLCTLPKEIGFCDAVIPRYYFDPSTETCESFIYGGCGGNENNFKVKNECLETCKPKY